MSKLLTALDVLKNRPEEFIKTFYEFLRHKRILCFLSDKGYIRLTYKVYFSKSINLDNPQTFNEKLNWLKLNYKLPVMRTLVDKFDVKQYVSQKIGDQYIVPSLALWDDYASIDLTNLPDKFVLKGTHDSSSVIICLDKSKFDIQTYERKLKVCLKSDLFHWGREWPYKGLKKRIIAETYLDDPDGLRDYKFFCFNGKVKCFKVDFDRFSKHRANYYDRNSKLLPISEVVCPSDAREYHMPSNLSEMIKLAEILSDGFPFVRVDLYNVKGKIYFGEMTFFPAAGFGVFTTPDADLLLGSWLQLPEPILSE